MRSPRTLTKAAVPGLLRDQGSPWGDRIELEVLPGPPGDRAPGRCLVRVRWAGESHDFIAESASRSTPKAVDSAVAEARHRSRDTGLPPMVLVPYLDERRLDRLADEGVSGIDLSGNGIVIIASRLLLHRSGRPNLHPESQPTKHAYRGTTSIVPRVFLSQSAFESVGAIHAAITDRGGSVALSTVSKALSRMVEDVLVERTGSRIILLQPGALLDRLRDEFRPPATRSTIRVRMIEAMSDLFASVNAARRRPRLVLSGASSQDRYAAGLRSDEPLAYCDDLHALRERIGDRWEETERFADLTVVETDDRTPFFDARPDASGLTHASPIQAYLELCAGDRRDREMAADVRSRIMRELEHGSST